MRRPAFLPLAGLVAGTVAWAAIGAVGCVLGPGFDGEDAAAGEAGTEGAAGEGGAASEDGSGADAGSIPSADGALPGGDNVLTNASFELGCAGWSSDRATTSESSIARTGAKSCKLCGTIDTPALYQFVRIDVPNGTPYYAEAWTHASDTTPTAQPPEIHVTFTNADNSVPDDDGLGTTGQVPGEEWSHLTGINTAKMDWKAVKVTIILHDEGGTCFLLDDISLYPLK